MSDPLSIKQALLTRFTPPKSSDHGTFGEITVDGTDFKCASLELPWRDNAGGKSCIPPGTYLFRWRTDSPKHGACYEEWDDTATARREDVPGRENIQLHAFNLAGDTEKGYVSEALGCIAPGQGVVTFAKGFKPAGTEALTQDQRGIARSRTALRELEKVLNYEPFELTVKWKDGLTEA